MSDLYSKFQEGLYLGFNDLICSFNGSLIFADQDGFRPKGFFTTMKILNFGSFDSTEEIYDFSNATIKTRDRITTTVSFQFYGDKAVVLAHEFKRRIRRRSFLNELYIQFKDIGVAADLPIVGDVQNLSQVLGTNFEERANIDLVFYLVDEIIDIGYNGEGGNYETSQLEITGDFVNAEGNTNKVTSTTKIL